MLALAKAWRFRGSRMSKDGAESKAPTRPAVLARPVEREQEQRGLTARELIRMAQSARITRN
ncbi:hypothetical protein [Methylobacterium sp. JK268]